MSSRSRKVQRLSQESDGSKHSRSNSGSGHHGFGDSSFEPHQASHFHDVETFADLSIKDFLDNDPRPAFVVEANADFDSIVEPVFLNAALRDDQQLRKDIPFRARTTGAPQLGPKIPSSDFKLWVRSIALSPDGAPPRCSFSYCGIFWTAFTVKNFVIVSGECNPGTNTDHADSPINTISAQRNEIYKESQAPLKLRRAITSLSEEDDFLMHRGRRKVAADFVTPGTPDWTLPQPEGDLSPHLIFARSIDWAATPLGDMSTWTREFRQIACLLMANPHPAALFWGDELTVIYNKPYADGVAGNKHPMLMGTGFRGPFKELWDLVSTIFDDCRSTGNSVAVTNQMLPIERHGFLEETFYTWSLTPLYGGTRQVQGLYNAPFETTIQTRAARALQTLFRLGQETALAQSVESIWSKILSGLTENVFDFPFVVLYSVADDTDDENISECSGSSQSLKSCILEGTLGVPENHHAVPRVLSLKRSNGGFVPSFRDAMQTREPKLLTIKDGTLSESLIEGFEWRGFKEPCREAVVCPLRPTTGENVIGFLVVGVNPRRQFDKDYESFIQLLDRQLATALASVSLLETEVRRGLTAAEAAAIERKRLSEELAVQKGRLEKIAEGSSVGMFAIDPDGLLREANDRWYEMTGHSREKIFSMSWMDTIHESSRTIAEEAWRQVVILKVPWAGEMRLKKSWYDPVSGDENEHWVTASSQPEFLPDGTLRGIMGTMTNISRIKWAENLQRRRLQEAEETRRAQNNFIDITSHEMRNPLSAILQCADGISSSLAEVLEKAAELDPTTSAGIKESISSAETIQLCAQHQKSIVDDILTISKLDSNLLLITPVPVQPVEIIKQALQMFVVECQKIHDISMDFHIDRSYVELGVETVMLDSARLLQVLINLLTNAIKFTKSCPKRAINVAIAAYLEPPAPSDTSFDYFPTKKARLDITTGAEWGTGEILYLRFEVNDSGCGLSPEEKKRLFNRFTQASPRTHVQYGGSGLGLFISRQLTELQGGEIGVASEAGVGSTFAFYVKARRASKEQNFAVIQKKLSADLQDSVRLSTSVVKTEADHAGSVSTLHQLIEVQAMTTVDEDDISDPRNWHVLIVEDNLVNQRILAQQIRKLGSTVHVANHGGEALTILSTTMHVDGQEKSGIPLSIILMDLEMPVMDGITCVKKIREMEAKKELKGRIPIIAVTANARGEQIANAKDSGMDDVMPKPFRIAQIKSKIEGLLASRRASKVL